MIKAEPKEVLSIRIPKGMKSELTRYCKSNNMTVSEYVGKSFTDIGQKKLFDVESLEIDQELGRYLTTIAGGSMVGILAYKGVYSVLEQKYPTWKKGEIEFASVASGMVVAMAVSFGIGKLMQLMND